MVDTPVEAVSRASDLPSRRADGLGWVEGRMRVSRRGRGGRERSRARSNGTKPYLSACGVNGGAGGALAEVGDDNCTWGGRAGGR